jgi:uncharacterized protein YbcI
MTIEEQGETRQFDDPRAAENSALMREVSRAMVHLYKEQFGRGPESVATHFSGSDTVVTILKNSLTPVELSMRAMGEVQRLRDIRSMFQYATEAKFRTAVEEATGRRVIGFMSGTDIANDLSCEVFTLEPIAGTPDGRRA